MPHDPNDKEKPYFDEKLHEAYLNTEYTCGRFVLKIGRGHPDFSDFLAREGFSSYAFITSWNPRSKALSKADNLARGQKFQLSIKALALDFMAGAAHDSTGEWKMEEGIFLFNVDTEVVLELATTWEQNAVVVGVRGGAPKLLWA
jgi:hypothetical protein